MSAALQFDGPSHSYTLGGRPVPGVTRVLQVLEDWDKVPFDVLEAARIFGQHVHQACALEVRGVLDWKSLDPALVPYVEGARNFLRQSGFVVLASELRLAHETLRFAGTGDLFGEMPVGRRTAVFANVDFKSGAFPRTVGPQTAAYSELYQHNFHRRVQRRYCVQLNPDFPQGFRVTPLTDTADWHVFLSCLNVWRFRSANRSI